MRKQRQLVTMKKYFNNLDIQPFFERVRYVLKEIAIFPWSTLWDAGLIVASMFQR